MAGLCEGCDISEWRAISNFFENDIEAIKFFKFHGVLPSEVHCHKCNNLCSFREDQRIWRCLKYVSHNRAKKRKCNFSISDFHGTFLDNCHISPWKILLFINCWLHKRFTHSEIYHNLDFSPQSSINWRSYCSEVTLNYFENQPKIGGPGVIVEIDESKFGKSKYNRGRYV